MEKKKKSYTKQLIKAMDVFLAIAIGAIFASLIYLVEAKDLINRIRPSYGVWLAPMYHGALVLIVAGMYLSVLPTLKEKMIKKADALLVGLLSCSLISVIYFVTLNNMIGIILWGVSLAISIVFFIVRAVSVKVETGGEVLAVKRYYAAVARKYDYALLMIVGAVAGLVSLAYVDFAALMQEENIYYAVGAIVGISVLISLYSIFTGKKAKVNPIDAILAFALEYVFIIGAFLFSVVRLRYAAVWAIALAALLATIVIRSIYVSVNVKQEVTRKGTANYYGAFLEKYSASLPILLGVAIGLIIDFISTQTTFAHIFDSTTTIVLFVVFAAIAFVVLAILMYGVSKQHGLTSKKVNLLDYALLITISGCLTSCGVFQKGLTMNRLIFVIVPSAIAIILTLIRIFKVEVVKPVVMVDDEIVIKITVAINDENVEVISEDAHIETIICDNRSASDVEEEIVKEEIHDEVVAQIPEEVVEETAVVEEVTPTEEVSEMPKFNIVKRTYEHKIKFTSDKSKEYYTEIKNLLMSYRAKSRVSKKAESFRRKGLLAKITVAGKSIRLSLALDPEAFDVNKYHQKDFGERRAYKDVPFTIKVRSDLGCKRACELIETLAEQRGLRKNKKYEPVNFAENLIVDGPAILEKLGKLDKLAEVVTKQQAEAMSDDILEYIPVVKAPKALNEESVNVYIDTALKYVNDTISADSLHEVQQIPATVEIINLKTRTGLDKKITAIVDEYDPVAAKLVLLCGGKVIKLERE